MTVQQSIMFGALVVGASIFGSRLVAPYQMAIGPAFIWRITRSRVKCANALAGWTRVTPAS